MTKRWIFPSPIGDEKIKSLMHALDVSPLTAAVLANRGYDGEDAKHFWDATGLRFRHFTDLPGAALAGERIKSAIQAKEQIMVFGDYDVDGITSAAMLAEFIRRQGGGCGVLLPNRLLEGYGLSQKAVAGAVQAGTRLLITVDCGITAQEEIAYARRQGVDVLVVDHHEAGEGLPEATVIVNPKVTGPEEMKILAGVGVTLQVVRAAAHALGEQNEEHLRRYLDLVALGTVADVVPLTGENRLLTRAGLAVINRGQRLGLRALAHAAGLGPGTMTSMDLAFRLAPRINAAGRLGDAQAAFDLLLTQDAETAEARARFLCQQNSKRQTLEQDVLEKAELQIQSLHSLPEFLVVHGEAWPIGVVGLTASRLCEKYQRPCFVLCVQNGFAKGSGRSVEGVSLHAALKQNSKLLENWGGHDLAAGITLAVGNMERFQEAMQKYAGERGRAEDRQPMLKIDACTTLKSLNPRLVRELKRFEPHGFRNARPLFAWPGLRVCLPPRVVGEKHLKFKVEDEKRRACDAIAFGMAARAEEIEMNNLVDIVGHASENVWNQNTTLQI
ncbi:single-stranded-DNA-specific exonuclease RecJ, partial [candidate division FCPU426 bacterium]|nr:single-stranded-DNA-specific exonuclease RecJ [candidate division FCPU426 bacterium]